jgi:hypothetical protein
MRVETSRRVGDSQDQRHKCKKCGRVKNVLVPRAQIEPRPLRSNLEQKKLEITTRACDHSSDTEAA